MKKNDLIKKLQEIGGNPDVVFWNGFVEDYNHISDITEDYLYMESEEYQLKIVNLHRESQGLKLIPREEFKFETEYEFLNPFYNEEQISKIYDKKKKIILINIKPRNKKTFDRCGGIEY